MRATGFHLRADCLSWEKNDGTAAKNKRILEVIPEQVKGPAIRSTKGWRDFNKAEIKSVKAVAMKKPQLGPKGKRAARVGEKSFCRQGALLIDHIYNNKRRDRRGFIHKQNNQNKAGCYRTAGDDPNEHLAWKKAKASRSLLRPRSRLCRKLSRDRN